MIVRRLKTIPATLFAWALTTVLLPVLLAGAVVVDVVRALTRRTHWMAIRLVAFLCVYLTAEVFAILSLALVWLVPPRRVAWTYALQGMWVNVLYWAVQAIFGVRLSVEAAEVAGPGPVLVFARHASIVDNLLPYRLVTRPTGIRLRYVLKHELLVDPALDIAGSRLPNHFVRRGSGESAREIAAVGALAEGLGSAEGVLIFPEGTRFAEKKRAAAIASAGRRNPEVREIAEGYRSVLPPRLGGPLALLAASDADVVVLAHRGLDGFATVADIWAGGIVGTRVAVRLTRIRRAEIPAERSDQAVWLHRVWAEVDDWVVGGGVGS